MYRQEISPGDRVFCDGQLKRKPSITTFFIIRFSRNRSKRCIFVESGFFILDLPFKYHKPHKQQVWMNAFNLQSVEKGKNERLQLKTSGFG